MASVSIKKYFKQNSKEPKSDQNQRRKKAEQKDSASTGKPSSFTSFKIKNILDFLITGKTTLIIAAGEMKKKKWLRGLS